MAFKSLSKATMVKRGFGQVEPNHLSARFTGEIYAQLPCDVNITQLEQGQFVKYNYANGTVDYQGPGEWMLVYNEIKLYRDWETDEDFAMLARDYNGYVYSPIGQNSNGQMTEAELTKTFGKTQYDFDPDTGRLPVGSTYSREVLETPAYMMNTNNADLHGDQVKTNDIVPRVFKTHEGDIFTTNMVNAKWDDVKVGGMLKVGAEGILEPGTDEKFQWQIVKKYTMPDMQPAVKVMRVI